MSEVLHLALDVVFRRSGAGYEAQVLRSPAGDGQSVTFARPFTDLELENFVLKAGAVMHWRAAQLIRRSGVS
jgi:hypothetical protein